MSFPHHLESKLVSIVIGTSYSLMFLSFFSVYFGIMRDLVLRIKKTFLPPKFVCHSSLSSEMLIKYCQSKLGTPLPQCLRTASDLPQQKLDYEYDGFSIKSGLLHMSHLVEFSWAMIIIAR